MSEHPDAAAWSLFEDEATHSSQSSTWQLKDDHACIFMALESTLLSSILLTASETIMLLRLQLPAVCRFFWHVMSEEPLCWRHLTLTASQLPCAFVTDEVVCRLARLHGPKLLQVSVDGARLLGPSSVSTIAYNSPQLQGFSAVGCQGISFASIRFLCKSCPVLEILRVAGCGCEADVLGKTGADMLAQTLAEKCPRIRQVALSNLRQEESLAALLKSTDLETLDLFDCQQLSCSEATFDLRAQRLQSLKLAGCTKLTSLNGCFSALQTLYLGGCVRFADADSLGCILKSCSKTLTFLSLVDCHSLSTIGLKAAFQQGGQCSLQTLVLGGCRVDDALCQLLGSLCPALSSLDLWNCPHVTNIGVSAIIQSEASLKELNLRECLKVQGAVLLEFCRSTSQLRTLDISFLGVVNDEHLLPLLQEHSESLSCLNCGGPRCFITERLLSSLPPRLEALDLADCKLLRDIEDLTKLQSLAALSLEGSVAPMGQVLEICRRCPITSLNLSRCAVGDETAKEIACLLPKLIELELSGTLLSDVGFRAITQQCRRLVQLGLRSCAISKAAVDDAKKTLPACVVDWDET
ncbi:Dynein regulatory complex subunit 6 (F-box and leucine-rich repeat protein 13) (F-box/LRR-repeat protein 13) [Durusdinium trenchii]|uniref:Dynein regulatory complex subunit 6 (F-box and leucine-rich repeat protein 13) (F-box/LRR-repeat protein 13) n=1 Tax=Durusdinium trenchii TaxID=1381693 RepID=A0ABP0KP14_9DINO